MARMAGPVRCGGFEVGAQSAAPRASGQGTWALALAVLLALTSSGCSEADPASPEGEDGEPLVRPGVAAAWVGFWYGSAEGRWPDGTTARAPIALEIRFDAPEIARPECPTCVTVTLGDSLFHRPNVHPTDPVTLALVDERADARRSLELTRWAAGGPGNAIVGRLRVTPAGDPGAPPSVDLALTLERR